MARPFGDLPTRFDPPHGPTGRVAIVAPGRAYSPAGPLLEFARQALLQHGWTVQALWWDLPADVPSDWSAQQVRAAVKAETAATELVVVGKSLGTRSAPYVATQRAPAIWLTPILVDEECVAGIRANEAPQLLVGGLADDLWDTDVAADLRRKRIEVVEIDNADHMLCIPGDAVASVEVHVTVSRAVDAFLAALDR